MGKCEAHTACAPPKLCIITRVKHYVYITPTYHIVTHSAYNHKPSQCRRITLRAVHVLHRLPSSVVRGPLGSGQAPCRPTHTVEYNIVQ